MSEPLEWTKLDLEQLIVDQVTESLVLDYKSSSSLGKTDGLKKEISKDVSAFANSAGGTIVYGIQEGAGATRHLPERLDDGCDPQDISREWLESVINSTIHPRIHGIRINPVLLDTAHVAYVVSVPQSDQGHMAGDNRYYKRYNFQSIPMEDYEVRDVMNRSSTPNLELIIRIEDIQLRSGAKIPVSQTTVSPPPASVTLDVSVSAINHATTPAEYAVFQLFVTDGITVITPGSFARSSQPSFEHVQIGSVKGFIKGWNLSMNHAIPGKMPIWSGPQWNVADNIRLGIPTTGYHQLGYTIQSPRMPIHKGYYSLHVDGATVECDFVRPEHLKVYLSVDSAIETGVLRVEDAPGNLPSP
jgi:hypothetical protein